MFVFFERYLCAATRFCSFFLWASSSWLSLASEYFFARLVEGGEELPDDCWELVLEGEGEGVGVGVSTESLLELLMVEAFLFGGSRRWLNTGGGEEVVGGDAGEEACRA